MIVKFSPKNESVCLAFPDTSAYIYLAEQAISCSKWRLEEWYPGSHMAAAQNCSLCLKRQNPSVLESRVGIHKRL